VIGYSGSGQGVRLTDAVVSTTVLPADENYQFNVSGVDQDGVTTAISTSYMNIKGMAASSITVLIYTTNIKLVVFIGGQYSGRNYRIGQSNTLPTTTVTNHL
jgi:hypothetical protein